MKSSLNSDPNGIVKVSFTLTEEELAELKLALHDVNTDMVSETITERGREGMWRIGDTFRFLYENDISEALRRSRERMEKRQKK